VVFIDESGINQFLYREYGWSQRGQKVFGNISGKRYQRESFIAGLKGKTVIAPLCYKGTCDSKLFNFWLANFLLPALSPGDVIVMDNAAFHKSDDTRTLIENVKCQLLFLPPYSPDLNPIEKVWANIKASIRKIMHQFSSLQEAIDYAFQQIV
jgi:transposase